MQIMKAATVLHQPWTDVYCCACKAHNVDMMAWYTMWVYYLQQDPHESGWSAVLSAVASVDVHAGHKH